MQDNDIKNLIAQAIGSGFSSDEILTNLETPPNPEMGDYALVCHKFAAKLRKSPQMIAGEIAAGLTELPYPLIGAEAIGGYVNFRIDKEYRVKKVFTRVLNQKENYGAGEAIGKTICIDYSSINIAKPFHIGHLSTTVIGAALYRIYKKLGYNVVGINHLGDWGTQFGKLIYAFLAWSNREKLKEKGISELTSLYVRFHKEAERDAALDEKAREWFKKLEEGDKQAAGLFNLFKEITLAEANKVYDRLGVVFDSYNGEAFYNDKMDIVIEELNEKGLLSDSEGAKIVNLEEYGMAPCLIKKADGASLYATRDLAAAYYRKRVYNFDKCLYVVAYQQNLHFRQVFKVLELLGKDWARDMVHVQFGMVSLEEGTMSTRLGKVVLLQDVLDRACGKALEVIAQKNPELEGKEEIAEMVGTGAVVFGTLYNNRIKDIVFSYDKALNFDGETGPYLQYTAARCASVLEKGGCEHLLSQDFEYKDEFFGVDNKEGEAVITLLDTYPAVIREAAEKYEPSLISRHLIDLAQAFNKFYYEHRILSEGRERAGRLALTCAVRHVLCEGLRLLGIKIPPKM
jgi:arginyl-tRNA synthetase